MMDEAGFIDPDTQTAMTPTGVEHLIFRPFLAQVFGRRQQ